MAARKSLVRIKNHTCPVALRRKVITLRNLVLIFFSKYINSLHALRDSSKEPPRAWHPISNTGPSAHHICQESALLGLFSNPQGGVRVRNTHMEFRKFAPAVSMTRQSLVGLGASRTTGGWKKKSNSLGTPSAVLCWKRYRLSHTCYNGNLGPSP